LANSETCYAKQQPKHAASKVRAALPLPLAGIAASATDLYFLGADAIRSIIGRLAQAVTQFPTSSWLCK